MRWDKKLGLPFGIHTNDVDVEAFISFIRHFKLTGKYCKELDEFCNIEKFMAGERSYCLAKYFGEEKYRLLPIGYIRQSAAYKDAEGHVLVLSLPHFVNEKVIETGMHDRGLVAVVLDGSHKFYNNNEMLVVCNLSTYDYFASHGYFDDGWGVKVLR